MTDGAGGIVESTVGLVLLVLFSLAIIGSYLSFREPIQKGLSYIFADAISEAQEQQRLENGIDQAEKQLTSSQEVV